MFNCKACIEGWCNIHTKEYAKMCRKNLGADGGETCMTPIFGGSGGSIVNYPTNNTENEK